MTERDLPGAGLPGAGLWSSALSVSGRRPVPVTEFGPWDVLSNLAHERYVEGDDAGCLDAVRHALQVTVPAGDVVTVRYLHYIECLTLEQMGDWAALAERTSALLDRLGPEAGPFWRAKVLGLRSNALLQRGEVSDALAALAEGYGLVEDHPGTSYNRGSACQALSGPLASALLFEPALELLRMSEAILADVPASIYPMLERSTHEFLRGLLTEMLGREREADAAYVRAASHAVRAVGAARRHADLAGEFAATASLTAAYQRLRSEPVDVALLRCHVAETGVSREQMISRLALASATARQDPAADVRAELVLLSRDAQLHGELVIGWVTGTWLAEHEEHEHGASAATAGWRQVAVGHLKRLLTDRAGRFEALLEGRRVEHIRRRADRDRSQLWEDPLTGVGNRRLLDDVFASPGGAALPLAFVDIDHFKSVNDLHGHDTGDRVLRLVAKILRAASRAGDVVARYGGDEFVVVLSQASDGDQYAERVRTEVAARDWSRLSPDLSVTVSVGVDGGGPGALARADEQLRRAKQRRGPAPPG